MPFSLMADHTQAVTVNGQQLTETVNKLTFDGDNVVLHLENGVEMTVDMADVIITFTVSDAIKALSSEPKNAPIAYFDLNGHLLKKAPVQGPYIMQKGQKVVKLMK